MGACQMGTVNLHQHLFYAISSKNTANEIVVSAWICTGHFGVYSAGHFLKFTVHCMQEMYMHIINYSSV